MMEHLSTICGFLSTLKRIGLFPFGIDYNIYLAGELFCDYLLLTN